MAATTGTAPAREAVGSADRTGPELHLQLDYPLPERLAVGAGTALFVCGWCFSPHHRVSSLSLVLDGEAQPVMAELMPRGDVFRALHPAVDPYGTQGLSADPDSEEDPELRSFRSGFWGLVRVPPRPAGAELDLRLRAVLDRRRRDGGRGCPHHRRRGPRPPGRDRPPGARSRPVRGRVHGHLQPAP